MLLPYSGRLCWLALNIKDFIYTRNFHKKWIILIHKLFSKLCSIIVIISVSVNKDSFLLSLDYPEESDSRL